MSYVTREGSQLMYRGRRFRYIGFNAYNMVVDSVSLANVRGNFAAARRHGVTVFRTWCFDRDNARRDNNGNLQGTNQPTNIQGNFRYLTTTAAGPDIMTNGTFETNTAGWGLDSQFTRSSADAHTGTYSVAQVSPSGSFQNFTTINDSTGIAVTPNTNYNFKFWYKMTVSGFGPLIYINSGNAYGSSIVSGALGNTSGAWVQATLSFNSGSNSKVWFRLQNNGGATTAFYDDFTLTTGTEKILADVESTRVVLDTLLDEARKSGIKVVLTLFDSNNYQGAAYPSKITYNNWANQLYGLNLNTGDNRTNTATDFFRSPYPRQLLKDFVLSLVNRINTVNGRLYKTDDTIMAWELGNETRFDSDQHEVGNANTSNAVSVNWIIDWIKDISGYIKSIDPNHLVTFGGCEYMPTKVFSSDGAHQIVFGNDAGLALDHVYVGSYNGIDYKRIVAECPDVDIISFHMYPNQGLGSSDIHPYGLNLGYVYSQRAAGLRAQIRAFIADTKAAGKVCEFGEIGYAREDTGTFPGWPMYPRDYAFENMFREVFDNDGDGILIWSATQTGGGSFSVGMDEVGTASYWGSNENKNSSGIMHRVNALNTQIVAPGKRPRSV